MDASVGPLASIYCCIIVILCSFYLINLVFAVIIESFIFIKQEEERKRELEIAEEEKKLNEEISELEK